MVQIIYIYQFGKKFKNITPSVGFFLFMKYLLINKNIMSRIVRLTERDLTRLVKRVIREQYEDDYTASGFDSMGDAAHSSLKSKGHSLRGKDDEG